MSERLHLWPGMLLGSWINGPCVGKMWPESATARQNQFPNFNDSSLSAGRVYLCRPIRGWAETIIILLQDLLAQDLVPDESTGQDLRCPSRAPVCNGVDQDAIWILASLQQFFDPIHSGWLEYLLTLFHSCGLPNNLRIIKNTNNFN